MRLLQTALFCVPLSLGWLEERQHQCTELVPVFYNSRAEPVASLRVELSACGLQLYGATLRLRAHFGPVSYILSSFFFSSAIIGIVSLVLLFGVVVLAFELRQRFLRPAYEPARL